MGVHGGGKEEGQGRRSWTVDRLFINQDAYCIRIHRGTYR